MKIEQIYIRNYKVFKELCLEDLPGMAIFVGENGTGKTTLFDVFSFLNDALQNNIKVALMKRGGYKEVVSRNAEEPILIELKFRLNITGKNRLVTYHLEIDLSDDGLPCIKKERLSYKRGAYGSPFLYLDFSYGKGTAVSNEEDFDKTWEKLKREEQTVSPDTLAIKGLGQFQRFKAANAFRDFIEHWHVSDFHIADARRNRDAGYEEHLSQTGDNLPLVARFMFDEYPELFKSVLRKMSKRVPGVEDVSAELTVDGRIVLKFKDDSFKDPFIAKHVSDGTIKMFAYLLLLHDPDKHPLLCIEEPENQLYPLLLEELLEEFRVYARKGGQVFITTHSPYLLNAADAGEVFWLKKEQGYTSVFIAGRDKKIKVMVDAGEKMGWLWEQGFFQLPLTPEDGAISK